MAGITSRTGFRYPTGADSPDVPRDITNLASDVEAFTLRALAIGRVQGGAISSAGLVAPGAGMNVTIQPGVLIVEDLLAGSFPQLVPVFKSGAATTHAVAASDPTNPRLDQWIVRRDGTIVRVGGTPTAGTTLDNRNGAVSDATLNVSYPEGWTRLADELIPAGSSSVLAANIRDRRRHARGASYAGRPSIDNAGGGTTSGSFVTLVSIDPTNSGYTQRRIECSGKLMRLRVAGTMAIDNIPAYATVLQDGVEIQYGYQKGNENWIGNLHIIEFEIGFVPTAGSHVFAVAIRRDTTNGVYLNKTHFNIEEDTRTAATNDTMNGTT